MYIIIFMRYVTLRVELKVWFFFARRLCFRGGLLDIVFNRCMCWNGFDIYVIIF